MTVKNTFFRGLAVCALFWAVGSCRPKPPEPEALPRLAVPFDGFTDGSNPTATPVPHAQPVATALPAQDAGDLPDPPAQRYREFVEYQLEFARGEVQAKSARAVQFGQPRPAERRVGRFALELFVGQSLLERTRFDFPLLGADGGEEDDPLEHGLTSQVQVLIPFIERANRAQVLDRKTRKVVVLMWPPFSDAAAATSSTAPSSSAAATSSSAPTSSNAPISSSAPASSAAPISSGAPTTSSARQRVTPTTNPTPR